MHKACNKTRRLIIQALGAATVSAALAPVRAVGGHGQVQRTIPGTTETIPAVGMGTWITFNTPPLSPARAARVAVLEAFFASGGTLVDSSPMYGFAESTIGHCLDELGHDMPLFSATKVWTPTRMAGIAQMKTSMHLWGLDKFDLMQVHNMVDWQSHLPELREWRDAGRLKYLGITTSHGRRHAGMLSVIEKQQDFDFVQFTYNLVDREAERSLLPAAAERGKAVIINRPFRRGALFERVRGKPLPEWAQEIDCDNWAQFFLKFVISHPAVTCAIPATSRVDHMLENMGALRGRLPDPDMRKRMIDHFERL